VEHLDMLLNDVHAMMRLPLKEEDLTAQIWGQISLAKLPTWFLGAQKDKV
jgi:hypothetical protein